MLVEHNTSAVLGTADVDADGIPVVDAGGAMVIDVDGTTVVDEDAMPIAAVDDRRLMSFVFGGLVS